MVVTAYCPCGKCCAWKRSIWSCWLVPVHSSGPFKGKRKKVGITADGTRAKKGVIAADISKYPYGTRMYVPGYGWGEVHDRGREMQGNRIDVFFEDHDDALKWGKTGAHGDGHKVSCYLIYHFSSSTHLVYAGRGIS